MAGDAPQENFSFVKKKQKTTNYKFTLHYKAFVKTFRYPTQKTKTTRYEQQKKTTIVSLDHSNNLCLHNNTPHTTLYLCLAFTRVYDLA